MTKLLMAISKSLCEYPDDIHIEEIPGKNTSIIEIRVHKLDQGKMIGKRGKIIQSIRNIVYASSFKYHKRYTVEILSDN